MTKKSKEINEEQVETVKEETVAGDSLKPAARSVVDPKALDASKVSMMKTMLHTASGMDKEDMTQWFNKAMALVGHEADEVGDNSGKNQSSVDMKTGSGPKTKEAMPKIASITPGQSMKEDVAELFGTEDLTEEFKEKAAAIFEAAVVSQVILAREELHEQFETKLAEEIERIETETTENLDKYLDYVVEEWMKDNEVAIESSLRTELTNDFIDGLKKLFAEHYIDLPEEKVEVVEHMADKVEELEKKLDEIIDENSSLKEALMNSQLSDVVEELAASMAMTQQEKFKSLAEEIEFDGDIDNFTKKLEIVKDTYFKDEKPAKSNIEEETFEGEEQTALTETVDPRVANYVKAISRTVKN